MAERLPVVLCFYAHIPDCRDLVTGDFEQPWVYLRAISDYVELAGYLETRLESRAVVCLSPIVLEQIAEYRDQLERWLRDGHRLGDPILSLFSADTYPATDQERADVCTTLLDELPSNLAERFPACAPLLELLGASSRHALDYRWLSDVCIGDLLVWLHLAWLAPCAHVEDLRLQLLTKKATGFSTAERRVVVEVIADLLAALPARYRSLHERGRIELATTLYTSPSVQLLCGSNPHAGLLESEDDSGHGSTGEHRFEEQLDAGVTGFEAFFGFAPHGCVVSDDHPCAALDTILISRGIDWVATRAAALTAAPVTTGEDYLPRFALADVSLSTEPRGVLQALETLAEDPVSLERCVVPLVFDSSARLMPGRAPLDTFLELCTLVSDHPALELSTFSRSLRTRRRACHPALPGEQRAGEPDAPGAAFWQMVTHAREAYLEIVGSYTLPCHRLQAAARQLMVCEDGAWLSATPQTPHGEKTRNLGQRHLRNLYRILGVAMPSELNRFAPAKASTGK